MLSNLAPRPLGNHLPIATTSEVPQKVHGYCRQCVCGNFFNYFLQWELSIKNIFAKPPIQMWNFLLQNKLPSSNNSSNNFPMYQQNSVLTILEFQDRTPVNSNICILSPW